MNFRIVSVGVVLALAQVGLAQFGPVDSTEKKRITVKANTFYRVTNREGTVKYDKIRITNDTLLSQGDVLVALTLEDTPDESVAPIKVERNLYSISLYPLTMWTVAGQIFNSSNNSVSGGTTTISGSTIAASALISNPKRRGTALELSGFYFLPYRESDGDFYQLSLGAMFTRNLGVQVGYYDSTKVDLKAISYHLLVRLASGMVQPEGGRSWGFGLGIGGFYNYSGDVGNGSGRSSRHTHNISAFVQGNYGFSDRLSLAGTLWFLRDRNVDVSRLSVGISYRF